MITTYTGGLIRFIFCMVIQSDYSEKAGVGNVVPSDTRGVQASGVVSSVYASFSTVFA